MEFYREKSVLNLKFNDNRKTTRKSLKTVKIESLQIQVKLCEAQSSVVILKIYFCN